MRWIGVVLCLVLTGCAQLAGSIPSLKYCSDVTYVRKGNQIDITAKCHAPIGDDLLP
jgi:hypothetical protein